MFILSLTYVLMDNFLPLFLYCAGPIATIIRTNKHERNPILFQEKYKNSGFQKTFYTSII